MSLPNGTDSRSEVFEAESDIPKDCQEDPVLIGFRLAALISKPITLCANRLNLLAEGDLRTPVPHITTKDETGVLAKSTGIIVDTLSALIDDECYLLESMAAGNFDDVFKDRKSVV